MRQFTPLLFAAVMISGCASRVPELGLEPGQTSAVQVREGGLPAPSGSDVAPEGRPYLIGPFDEMRIEVFGVEDLSRDIQADASGRISFPLVGVIDASGKTPIQLEQEIAERLRGYVRDPQVSVNLTETVSQVVTVDGEVRQPGLYPVLGRMTLMRAIATARGTSEFARQSHVLIFRRVNGQDMVGLYNLGAIRQGVYADPEIYAGDVVVVDEARSRRMFQSLLQVAPAVVSAPLVALLQNN